EMINYGITKTAQAALARGLAREFGGCGVTVNAVLPGPTRTEGISTMLADESKRTGKSVRKLEQEFFSVARSTSIIQPLAEHQEAIQHPGVEAVILATPHSLHAEQIERAVAAGKHIFCEKPLALTKSGAEAVVAACAKNNLVLGMGHERRWEPPVAQLLDMAR